MTGVDRGAMGRGNVFGGSLPAMIWGALNAAYHAGLGPLTFEAPEWTRAGTRIRTDQKRTITANSSRVSAESTTKTLRSTPMTTVSSTTAIRT